MFTVQFEHTGDLPGNAYGRVARARSGVDRTGMTAGGSGSTVDRVGVAAGSPDQDLYRTAQAGQRRLHHGERERGRR